MGRRKNPNTVYPLVRKHHFWIENESGDIKEIEELTRKKAKEEFGCDIKDIKCSIFFKRKFSKEWKVFFNLVEENN